MGLLDKWKKEPPIKANDKAVNHSEDPVEEALVNLDEAKRRLEDVRIMLEALRIEAEVRGMDT